MKPRRRKRLRPTKGEKQFISVFGPWGAHIVALKRAGKDITPKGAVCSLIDLSK